MTFVFHDEDSKDSLDRVVHEPDRAERDTANEPSWTIYNSDGGKKKVVFGTRRTFSPNIPINALDLNGPSIIEFSSENQLHEWAIYVSARQIFFWRDGLINTKRMDQINRKCRKVTDIYNPINHRTICDIETLKKRIHDQSVQFSNSECWAAWCFYGDVLFCANSISSNRAASANEDDRNWCLQWNDLTITERFKTLDGAITSRRENEKGGLVNLQKHFGVRVAHKGFVTCIQ